MGNKKQTPKIPREQIIEFDVNNDIDFIELSYNFSQRTLTVVNSSVENCKVQTTYLKNSGKTKITNAIPVNHDLLYFDSDSSILNNYDLLIAVDTNTKIIDDIAYSITTSYLIENPLNYYNSKIPFINGINYIFKNVKSEFNAEKLGWYMIISNLINSTLEKNFALPNLKVGLIVDSDLGKHEKIRG